MRYFLFILGFVSCFTFSSNMVMAQQSVTTTPLPTITPTPTPWPTATPTRAPKNIELMGQIGGILQDTVLWRNYIYINVGTGIKILSHISTPPQQVAYFNLPYLQSLYIKENYLYAITNDGIHIFDLSIPTTPIEVATYTPGDRPFAITNLIISNNYAYIPIRGKGISILDISDPTQPKEVGLYKMNIDYGLGMVIQDNYAYFGINGGLQIVDFSNPAKPVIIGTWKSSTTDNQSYGVKIVNNYVYLSKEIWPEINQTWIIDISDLTKPKHVGFTDIILHFI